MAASANQSAEPLAGSPPGIFLTQILKRPGIVCFLLAMTTFVVYLPVANHDYVNYDDADYVTANPHVQGGLKWENVMWALGAGHASNWHPLTWLSHMLDWQLFGKDPGPQHLVNVLFHVANAVILFLLLRQMTRAHWPSALVAALFALHSFHCESGAWISERKDVLSTFFLLLTMAAYVAYVREGDSSQETG